MSGPDHFPAPGAPAPDPGQVAPVWGSTPAPPPYAGAPGPYAPAPGPYPPPPGYGPLPGHVPGAGLPSAAPPPWFRGAAHKPGAIPLRPLGLGDIYDGALKIIRFNPKATVGSAVLVAAISMAIPVLLTALLTFALDLSMDPESDSLSGGELAGIVGSGGSLALGVVLQSLGLILVTGMIAHVVAAAAIGQRLSLGEAWARTRGRRWRLIGLALLLGLVTLLLIAAYVALWVPVVVYGSTWVIVGWAVLSVPAFLALMAWFWVRVYYLPVPALMLEPVGVMGAVGRGWRLTGRTFWRTFGIALLTVLIAQIAGSMLTFPVSILGQLGLAAGATSRYAMLILVLTQAVTSVLSAAFVAPFTTAVASLQYLDLRMRKEAYDVELMSQAGITRS